MQWISSIAALLTFYFQNMTYYYKVLKLVLTLCLLMYGFNSGYAQNTPHPTCGTVNPQFEELKKHKPSAGNLKIDPICNPTGVIPVVLHVITDIPDGTGNSPSCPSQADIYTKDDAACALTDLNAFFPIPGISFRLADYDKDGVMVNGMTQRRSPFTHNASLLNRSEELDRFPADQYLNIWITTPPPLRM